MSSSSSSSRAQRRGSSGGSRHLQFPVGGRWRHVAVVDAGCGCRPRRATTRLLSQLPSFLRPSATKPHHQPGAPVRRTSSRSSSGFFPSSASTASSSAATLSSYSNYSAYSTTHAYHKHQQQNEHDPTTLAAPSSRPKATTSTTPHAGSSASRKRQAAGRKKKHRYETAKMAEAEDVGVAVEKESSDPRADFRDSMVQMVVEMGLCGWDDLRCMLRRLLALNAPSHHAAILAAFAEVCAQLTAPLPPPTQPQPPYPAYTPYQQCHSYDDYHYHY